MSLKKLIELKHKFILQHYMNVPIYALPKVKYSDKTANELTNCIIDWLTLNGWQAERISNTGRYIDNRKKFTDTMGYQREIGSGKWIPGQGTKGTADISATVKGMSVKWEVKIKDKQSEAQKKYQESIENAGGKYFIAHNFDEFYEQYNRLII